LVDRKDLRKRLDELNREPLPERDASDLDVEQIRRRIRKMRQEAPEIGPEAIQYRRDLPRDRDRSGATELTGPSVSLEQAAPGREVAAPSGGRAYLIETPLADCGPDWAGLSEGFRRGLCRSDSDARRRVHVACGMGEVAPEDVVFLDLETTGLAGTPLFLIGTMVWQDGGLVVRQCFARNYAEERAVISLFLRDAARRRLLISFNGKSFDVPYVRVRAVTNGLPFSLGLAHLDLLHECRRAWRRRLPDCRLQTLEHHICGRLRSADIPGSEIPDAYHAFVRTGNAVQMADVLEHNRLDLATLADLLLRLPGPSSP
jgi:uncharacterized protein YprB with RNaseH-like and TPR domain